MHACHVWIAYHRSYACACRDVIVSCLSIVPSLPTHNSTSSTSITSSPLTLTPTLSPHPCVGGNACLRYPLPRRRSYPIRALDFTVSLACSMPTMSMPTTAGSQSKGNRRQRHRLWHRQRRQLPADVDLRQDRDERGDGGGVPRLRQQGAVPGVCLVPRRGRQVWMYFSCVFFL